MCVCLSKDIIIYCCTGKSIFYWIKYDEYIMIKTVKEYLHIDVIIYF